MDTTLPTTPTADHLVCLVDGAAGIYCPQRTAERLNLEEWGIFKEIRDALLAGPDADDSDEGLYLEFWDDVLNNAEITDKDGHKWTLYQDQDVWMVRDDVDSSWFEG